MYKLAEAHCVWSLLHCDLLDSRKEEDTATLWARTWSEQLYLTLDSVQHTSTTGKITGGRSGRMTEGKEVLCEVAQGRWPVSSI